MLESLSQFYLPGAVTMWCALFFALASLWGYAQALRGDTAALHFARRGYTFFSLSILMAGIILFVCLARRDFRIEYVYQYSGLDLPFHFQVAAFWAGQKGSFLIWLVWGALIGLPLLRSAGRDEPAVMIFYLLNLFGLLFILVRENPFVMLEGTPVDGAGLNPLLQDDWMVIHPPIMFIGYSAAAIPMAFALAALWRGDTSRWANRCFPWALAGFLVLGTAILMGGYWAYVTLGWGGYWGWDPVENASLIPWLIGVVLIHGLYMERTKGRFRRLNLVLACMMYLSVLYGTFLTRSGVLADFSVHSFVDLGISRWLTLWMAFFFFASLYLLATRLKHVETRANEDPLLSRGFFLVLSTSVVSLSTLVITIGTSAPLLTKVMENPAQVGPSFYNTVNMPLALVMVFLLAYVPFLTWKGTPPGQLHRKLIPSFLFGAVATVVSLGSGVEQIFHAVFIFLSATALAANVHKVIDKARGPGGLASAGGYLAHVGVGVMFLGVLASSAYDFSTKVTLEQDVPQQVGEDLTLTFKRFVPRDGWEKEKMEVLVERDDGFSYLAYPSLFVNDRTRQLMANPHVRKTAMRDYYISPIQYEPAEPKGVDHRIHLAKGESTRVEGYGVRFVEFDLAGMENPTVQLASGGMVTVGATLELSNDNGTQRVTPVYSFRQNGELSTPPTQLDDGWVAITAIDPDQGRVQLDFGGFGTGGQAARLSIDVTRKPLIALVWYGLYIVLAGGFLATVLRWRQARQLDALDAEQIGTGA